MLDVGETAPGFELLDQNRETVSLSDYDGEWVVLYFYPKANTPGCTDEACSFRDAYEEFQVQDVTVLGISADAVDEINAFAEENDLPFRLLSDEDGRVASTYESFGTVEKGGNAFDIAFRNTYVVDPDGTIEAVYEDVSPDGHAEEILADLAD